MSERHITGFTYRTEFSQVASNQRTGDAQAVKPTTSGLFFNELMVRVTS